MPSRIYHISVDAADPAALGARRADVGQGPEATWVVLADPEGNEFCVLRPRKSLVA